MTIFLRTADQAEKITFRRRHVVTTRTSISRVVWRLKPVQFNAGIYIHWAIQWKFALDADAELRWCECSGSNSNCRMFKRNLKIFRFRTGSASEQIFNFTIGKQNFLFASSRMQGRQLRWARRARSPTLRSEWEENLFGGRELQGAGFCVTFVKLPL